LATIAVLPSYSVIGAAVVMATAEAALATSYWILAARGDAPRAPNGVSAAAIAPQD
jgi:hypothetical protein